MAIVLVFGSSITYGYGDSEGGWVQRLRKETDKKTLPQRVEMVKSLLSNPDQTPQEEKYSYIIYNQGISGNNSRALTERFDNEIKARFWPDSEIITLICIGLNDALFLRNENNFWVPMTETKENIKKIISQAKKYSSKVAFIGLTLVDEKKSTPVAWSENFYYRNEDIKVYNNSIKEVCLENNVPFLDLIPHFESQNYKELLLDGVHPNNNGHEFMYNLIRDYLEENKIIEF